jgi:two-component system chemotaxis response regulator CheV
MAKSEILLEVGTNELEILEFFIDAVNSDGKFERIYFGMNVAKVMQVIESPHLERCNHAPHPSFLGIIPLREHILPVIDLSVWLGIDRKLSDDELVVVTEFSQSITGFLVSGVTEIHRLGWNEVKPPVKFITQYTKAVLIGTIERDDRIIQLLDIETILTDLDPEMMRKAEHTDVYARFPYPALVVDDSETIRKMVSKNLTAAKLKPTFAGNGQEAWEILCRLRDQSVREDQDIFERVRIIISDIEMPMLDGFTLTKNIKEDPILGKIPVILYSSIITPALRHKGDSVKADDQVSKPELHLMAKRALQLIEGVTEG